MWTELRQNIEKIRQENKIPDDEFKPLDIHSWQHIQQNIIFTFCNIPSHKDNFNWLWENFKLDTYSVRFDRNWPFDSLLQLIDNSEKVWLFINESISEGTKFWFYEGKINAIVLVLGQSYIDEVYIASKKYDWLICITHDDVLVATGLYMPSKLKQLEKENLLTLK